jgi:hypothetical protein
MFSANGFGKGSALRLRKNYSRADFGKGTASAVPLGTDINVGFSP